VGKETLRSLHDIKQTLLTSLDDFQGIAAVYLFESSGTSSFGPESDIDVAILFSPETIPSPREVFDLQATLSEVVNKDVHIVVLNTASPIIGMQVLKKGEKILERSSRLTTEFFVRTVTMYADLKIVRKQIERHLILGQQYG
jgi:predicted nucleotidyltransferase